MKEKYVKENETQFFLKKKIKCPNEPNTQPWSCMAPWPLLPWISYYCVPTFCRSFLQLFLIGSSESFTNAVLDCDKSHVRDVYEYFKLQLQILGWGQGNVQFILFTHFN